MLVAGIVVLLLVFLAARFPYQRLLPPLLDAARAATGAEIDVADLGLGLGLGGPEVVASGVRLRWPAAPELVLDEVAALLASADRAETPVSSRSAASP